MTTLSLERGAVARTHAPEAAVSATRSSSGRLLNFDLLRGYFVVMLAAIHLDYLPSLFGAFDGRGALWVSEADGFFLISGLLAAMLRRRELEKGGLGLATRKSWRRARQLYVLACALTIVYTLLGRVAVHHGRTPMVGLDASSSWSEVVTRTLTLRYVYGWADFLTLYVPMFLALPLLVWALRRRLDAVVVVASIAAYASLTWHSWGDASPYIQWQADFVLGAVAGYHFTTIRARLAGASARVRLTLAWLVVIAAIAIYTAGTVMLYHPWWYDHRLSNELLANNRLGLLRPLLAVLMVAGEYVLLSWLRKPLMATVGPLLELFGKNSLYVYVLQSAFVFVIPFLLPDKTGLPGFFGNTALDLSIIAVIWLGLRTNFLTRYVPR